MKCFPRLVSNCKPPDFTSQAARVTGISHQCPSARQVSLKLKYGLAMYELSMLKALSSISSTIKT
jgi:hypothetical protein